MAREVYTDEEFVEFSRKFVFMRVLSDEDPEGAQLKDRFQVSGFPTLLILDSEGREIDRIMGARTAEELIQALGFIYEYTFKSSSLRL